MQVSQADVLRQQHLPNARAATTPQRPPQPVMQSLRFAPSPENEVIKINEDGWTESSDSRPMTPTPSGPSQSTPIHCLPHTPPSPHTPHTPSIPHTPRSPHTPHTPRSPRAGPHSQERANVAKAQRKKSKRGIDVSTFFTTQSTRRHCIFCQQLHSSDPEHDVTNFAPKTSTSVLRSHLVEHHLAPWVDACDKLKITITAKGAQGAVLRYREQKNQSTPGLSSPPTQAPQEFSHKAFVNTIIEWIVADDQSLNVIESPQLRAIFQLLRHELKDSDIPSRTTICNRISDILQDHIDVLKKDMQQSASISIPL
ncbi:hypothetical protein QCA50_017353 [Cerrena zonata]|uniref:BED-type domain-containing protein n=1 Tax=Cerrena zonata TaxID=2478898 RepID=A0AAW0FGC7_9APHY